MNTNRLKEVQLLIVLSISTCSLLFTACSSEIRTEESTFELEIEQLTFGEKHHFFGYIGQCRTIPWNESGQYILGLEIENIDRMPEPSEGAKIFIIDTKNNNENIYLDETHAWNPQQ